MKKWCRENLGKNPYRGSPIWKSEVNWEHDNSTLDTYHEFSFLFAEEEHATWFLLIWCDKLNRQ
jgi:hypothetical protein